MTPSPPTAVRVGVGSPPPPPPSARAGPLPASGCQQGRGGAGGRLRVFKGSLRRLLSSKLTAFGSWTPVTMWFLILFLALSLGGTGAVPPIQSRVIGGFDCVKNSQPWMAAVYHYSKFQCGGILVDPEWVLTAAHCYNDKYQIWLGRNNIFENEPEAQHMFVKESIIHPDFNMDLLMNITQDSEADYSNDLMLLHLHQPAKITDYVKVLSLPTEEPKLGSSCLASGWGSIEPSKCVYLDLLPNEECAKVHSYTVTDVMLCVGDLKEGKDTCVGDSGGPLICDGVFQGVTSWGPTPCGIPEKPGIYTKLIGFVPWINNVIRKNTN
ncbi:Kallikrein 1-related peptidase b5 [Lemmus lemmus]